jgi:protein-disulfide isomerase
MYYVSTTEVIRELLESLGEIGQKFQVEVIDVEENLDLAEKYNILALPTVVIGEKHFVGNLSVNKEELVTYLEQEDAS